MVATDPRSKPLRRLDFRFLLGSSPVDDIGVEARPELIDALGELGHRPSRLSNESGPHDLVVLSNPSRRTLRRAHDRLKPGGVVFVERTRPRPGGVQMLRRSVRTAQFEAVDTYWTWPSFARTQPLFWLGLEGSAARNHISETDRRRWRLRVLARLWVVARHLGVLAPLAAVGWKPRSDGATTSLKAYVAANHSEMVNNASETELSCSILTGGHNSMNKVVHLMSSSRESAPALAIKVARNPAAEAGLQREASTLSQVSIAGELRAPRLIFAERLGAHLFVGESVERGTPLIRCADARREELAFAVIGGLAQFADEVEPTARALWWERLVVSVIDRFCAVFETPRDSADIRLLVEKFETIDGLALVPEHRDCSPWNVLSDGTGLVLLDWESSEPNGLPLLDAVYFLAQTEFVAAGTLASGREDQTYAQCVESPDSLFVRGLAAYTEIVKLAPSEVAALRVLTWMVHAPVEYERLRSTGQLDHHSAIAQSVTYRLCQQEQVALRQQASVLTASTPDTSSRDDQAPI